MLCIVNQILRGYLSFFLIAAAKTQSLIFTRFYALAVGVLIQNVSVLQCNLLDLVSSSVNSAKFVKRCSIIL